MNQKIIIAAGIALILGIGVGYGGAHALAKSVGRMGSGYARAMGGVGMGGMFGGRAGGGFLAGTVAKVDAGSLTLNTRDGSSHVVLLSSGTTVSKSVAGALADIAVGADVIVSGTTSADGSVAAALVQIRPAGSSMGGLGR